MDLALHKWWLGWTTHPDINFLYAWLSSGDKMYWICGYDMQN